MISGYIVECIGNSGINTTTLQNKEQAMETAREMRSRFSIVKVYSVMKCAGAVHMVNTVSYFN